MDEITWRNQVKILEKKRWLICLPLALAFLIVYFHRLSAGVVSDSLMSEFNIATASELGILSSIYFYTYAVLQIPAGILADRYGARLAITLGVSVAGAGAFLFGWAPSLTWLYAARFIVSVGVAFIYINIVKIFAEWFRAREFGTMSGLSAFIGNSGAILAATPLAMMVEGIGWRLSFYMIAACSFIVAAYCWSIVRNKPAELGMPSINEVEAREGPGTRGVLLAQANVWRDLRVVVTNWYTWPPLLASTGIYGVYMAFAGIWGVPYLMQVYGMSRVTAANYIVVASVGYMLASPLLGYVSDHIKSRRLPYAIYTAIAVFSWTVLTWNGGHPPIAVLFLVFFLIGFGSSAVSLTLACAKEVNPTQITGMATGTANIGPFIGAAIIQPAFGWVLDQRWQGMFHDGVKIYPLEAYYGAFWFCLAIMLLSGILVFFIKETNCVNVSYLLAKKNGDIKLEGDSLL